MARDLRIVTWNANGVRLHIPELEVFLESHNIDVACITETHLSAYHSFHLQNYVVVRRDRPSARCAGVAVCIRRSINFLQVGPDTGNVESIGIRLTDTPLQVFAAYCPPRQNLGHKIWEVFNHPNRVPLPVVMEIQHGTRHFRREVSTVDWTLAQYLMGKSSLVCPIITSKVDIDSAIASLTTELNEIVTKATKSEQSGPAISASLTT